MFGMPQYLMVNREKKYYLTLPARDAWGDELWKIWKFIRAYENIEIVSSCDPTFDPILRSDIWMDFGAEAWDNLQMQDMIVVVSELIRGAGRAQYIVHRMNSGEIPESVLR